MSNVYGTAELNMTIAPSSKNKKKMLNSQDRRNDYDVTNTVQVSDPVAVRNAVSELFTEAFPGASFDKLWLAFYDFARLFSGQYPAPPRWASSRTLTTGPASPWTTS